MTNFSVRDSLKFSTSKLLLYLTVIAIFISVLSQLPLDINNFDVLNLVVWAFVGVCFVFVPHKILVSNYLLLLIFNLCFFASCQLTGVIIGDIKVLSPLIRVICIPILIYYVSYYLIRQLNDSGLILFEVYVLGMSFLCFYLIFSQVLGNFSSWMSSSVYLLKGSTHKNTLGQLLGTAIIIVLYLGSNFKIIKNKAIKVILLATMIMALVFVQSRSSLLLVGMILMYSILKKVKIVYFIPFSILFIFVLTQTNALEIISHAFQIDKYTTSQGLNLNNFSSGRLFFYDQAFQEFIDHPILGRGGGTM